MDNRVYEKGSSAQIFWIGVIALLFGLLGIWAAGG